MWITLADWVSKVSCSLAFVRNAWKAEEKKKLPSIWNNLDYFSKGAFSNHRFFFFFKAQTQSRDPRNNCFISAFSKIFLWNVNNLVFLQFDIQTRKVYLSNFYYECVTELNELCWGLSSFLINCTKTKFIFFKKLTNALINLNITESNIMSPYVIVETTLCQESWCWISSSH